MPSTVSPSMRPGDCRWWGRALMRGDLLTFLVAAMLCSASYCLAIWHNSRGAADSRVLVPSAGAAGASSACQSEAPAGVAEADADEPLDFEAHHTAESAELSVPASAAATTTTTRVRRALRGAVASWARNSAGGAEAGAGASR